MWTTLEVTGEEHQIMTTTKNQLSYGKPYDQELNWIAPSGSAWIETTFAPLLVDDTIDLDFTFPVPHVSWPGTLFGVENDNNTNAIACSPNGPKEVYAKFFNPGGAPRWDFPDGSSVAYRIQFHYENRTTRFDCNGTMLDPLNGISPAAQSTLPITKPLWLFRRNNATAASTQLTAPIWFHSFTVRRGGKLLVDVIPVIAAGEPMCYDRAGKVLLPKCGDGSFTFG